MCSFHILWFIFETVSFSGSTFTNSISTASKSQMNKSLNLFCPTQNEPKIWSEMILSAPVCWSDSKLFNIISALPVTVKIVILLFSNVFSIITPDFSVTWSYRNHSNMLIWWSRNLSYHYHHPCWRQLCHMIFFCGNCVHFLII